MSGPDAGADNAPERTPLSADRLKAFTDAVVAIAMTLLILPLMDSVSESAAAELATAGWLGENGDRLFSFVLSFVLIANFWIGHHRMFDRVERVTGALVWLTVIWMFTIVCLPVTTAVLGSFPTDTRQKLLYIGNLLAASLVSLGTRVYIGRHPALHHSDGSRLRLGVAADIILSTLFAVALVLSIVAPALGYWTMFLLLLTGPLLSLAARTLPRPARLR